MPGHIKRITPEGVKPEKWQIVVEAGRGANRKRKRIKKVFIGGQRAAKNELLRLRAQLATGLYVEPKKWTLAQYLEHWLDTYGKPNLAPSTYASYERIIRKHISLEMGQISIEKVQPMHIQAYYSQKLQNGRRDGAGGLSARTVQYHHRVLREALHHAVKWQILVRNPADACEAPRPSRPEMSVLDAEGVSAMLEIIEGHPDRDIFITAVFTGMRQGELLGLRWQDVDLNKRVVRIQQSVGFIPKLGFVFREPKTKRSRRQVVLPQMAVDALTRRQKQVATDKIFIGADLYKSHDLVFCTNAGAPLDPSGLSRRFKRIATKVNAPKLRFHDLRHTHATMLLSQGVHPKVVQERLGHESINITLDTYSHVLPGMQEDAVAKMELALGFESGHQVGTKQSKNKQTDHLAVVCQKANGP